MIATEDERLGLLEGILAEPDDDGPRLVYADWLEENGEAERAEFIRTQLELAEREHTRMAGDGATAWREQAKALRRREEELLEAHGVSWAQPIADLFCADHAKEWFRGHHGYEGCNGVKWQYRRGLIASVTLSAEDWLKNADELLWWPEEPCRRCDGEGVVAPSRQVQAYDLTGRPCPACRGSKYRPMPPTAQPIEEVTLTTWPTLDAAWDDNAEIDFVRSCLNGRWPQIRPENWHLPGEEA